MVVASEAYVGCNKRVSPQNGRATPSQPKPASCVAAVGVVLYKLTVSVMRAAGRRLVNSGTGSD